MDKKPNQFLVALKLIGALALAVISVVLIVNAF